MEVLRKTLWVNKIEQRMAYQVLLRSKPSVQETQHFEFYSGKKLNMYTTSERIKLKGNQWSVQTAVSYTHLDVYKRQACGSNLVTPQQILL